MIRVSRPAAAPFALIAAQSKWLPVVKAKKARGEALEAADFKEYGVAKPALAALLKDKCWYCEKKVEVKYDGVDHRRPKTEARRGPNHPTSGYWWLAWTWENLLFACDTCNKIKGTRFPLTPKSIPLVDEEMPPGKEEPLLLDPTVDDPLDHIRFVPERDGRWRPIGKTAMGRETIDVLQLDGIKRPQILDHYRDHVNERVRPRIEAFKAMLGEGNMRLAHAAWYRMCRSLLRHSSPFAALSYDAILVLVSRQEREAFVLPRPPYLP